MFTRSVFAVMALAGSGWLTAPAQAAQTLNYVQLVPCVVVDTRLLPGGATPFVVFLGEADRRGYDVTPETGDFSSQGGSADGCGVPDTAKAVLLSIKTQHVNKQGRLTVYQQGEGGGAPEPAAPIVNFDPEAFKDNAGGTTFLCQGAGCTKDITVEVNGQPDASAHAILTVMGYFVAPDLPVEATLRLLLGEHCQAALLEGASPSELPTYCEDASTKLVFVTSTVHDGDLNEEIAAGGLDGGDAICNARAAEAGLPGTYAAWLSTRLMDAKDRIGDSKWMLVDGNTVANNLAALINTATVDLLEAIFLDETGTPVSTDRVWTGTLPTGEYPVGPEYFYPCLACCNWADAGPVFAIAGVPTAINENWTFIDLDTPDNPLRRCDTSQRLYCFGK